jgi:aspartyl-tRNA(Asn)/glutamyl-tRNA(Gln) amidotransferase subunit A
LGVTTDFVGAGLSEEVQNSFQHTLHQLESAGASVNRFSFPELMELPAIYSSGGLAAAEAWVWHRTLLEHKEKFYDQRVAVRIRRGGQLTAAQYMDLLDARSRLITVAQRLLRSFDAWIMPTVAMVAPLLAPLEKDDAVFFATNALAVRNPSVINFLDGCAVTIPYSSSAGLPVGLSICGLGGQDARVLQIGRTVESLLRNTYELE